MMIVSSKDEASRLIRKMYEETAHRLRSRLAFRAELAQGVDDETANDAISLVQTAAMWDLPIPDDILAWIHSLGLDHFWDCLNWELVIAETRTFIQLVQAGVWSECPCCDPGENLVDQRSYLQFFIQWHRIFSLDVSHDLLLLEEQAAEVLRKRKHGEIKMKKRPLEES